MSVVDVHAHVLLPEVEALVAGLPGLAGATCEASGTRRRWGRATPSHSAWRASDAPLTPW